MDAAAAAKVLAALGHEGRLTIFRLLAQAGPHGLPAGEAARQAGQLQNTASSHLGILSNVGLVSSRRNGRSIIYAAVPARLAETLAFLIQGLLDDDADSAASRLQRMLDTAWEAGGRGENAA